MEEKKLTAEQIINALKVVKKETLAYEYDKEQRRFEYVTGKEILDLILLLQAEIERLTEENGYLKQCADNFLADYQKAQKQVDELKDEREKAYEIERSNIQAEIAEAGTSCQWCKNVTVKDTAKEILGLILAKEFEKGDYLTDDELHELFKERYGVEVE